MRLTILALVLIVSGWMASDVQAAGGCRSPFCAGGAPHNSGWATHHGAVGFQAAPWYLYWPYDAHFQLPAPVAGAYSPPPAMGGYPAMPFFPYSGAYVPGSPLNYYPYGPTMAPGYAR